MQSKIETLRLSSNQPTAAERLKSAPTQLDALFESGQANDETTINAAIASAQGTSSFVAREGIGAANARNVYNDAVSNLLPGDSAGRTQIKAAAREATPPVTRAVIQKARRDLGPRAGSVSSANKSNAGANRLAGRLGTVGKVGAV